MQRILQPFLAPNTIHWFTSHGHTVISLLQYLSELFTEAQTMFSDNRTTSSSTKLFLTMLSFACFNPQNSFPLLESPPNFCELVILLFFINLLFPVKKKEPLNVCWNMFPPPQNVFTNGCYNISSKIDVSILVTALLSGLKPSSGWESIIAACTPSVQKALGPTARSKQTSRQKIKHK